MKTIILTHAGVNAETAPNCTQCGASLANDMLAIFTVNQVCANCVAKNHKKVTGN